MKRIIDGKRYDTETAEAIGSASSHLYSSDFGYWSETLYRTRKGGFFIAGEGGPSSHYAQPVGNNGWGSGEGLRVVSEEQALGWLERHGLVERIELHFGGVIQEG